MKSLHMQSQFHGLSSRPSHAYGTASWRVCCHAHPSSSTVNSSSSSGGPNTSYHSTLGSMERCKELVHSGMSPLARPPSSSFCSRSSSESMCSTSSSKSRRVAAAAASADQQQPDLSALRKGSDLERLLFAQMAQGNASSGPQKPNAPITPGDFVEALEMVVRSKGQQVNPEQLDEIFIEVVQSQLLEQFTPAQLATTAKNLAVMCESVPGELLEALLLQIRQKMAVFDARQLSNIAWSLMRLVPVAVQEIRESIGMDQQWIDAYMAAVEQQLQRIHDAAQQQQAPSADQQQQQPADVAPMPKLPSAQQVANLLLLPAAAMQPLQPSLLQLLEAVVVMRQASLCGFAVAQLLTCYVRLSPTPGPLLLQTLLDHLQEDLQLYDYDELTQVTFNAYVLQLQLSDTLLADITQRADMLEAAGQAAEQDKMVLKEALQRLAAQKARVSVSSRRCPC